jgi:hypothetical protein
MSTDGEAAPPNGTPPPSSDRLRPISLEEEIALEAYREAIKAGLTSADSAADKVLTASLSIATAYAGLLALVKPEKEAAPTILALPFIALGLAAFAAAWAIAQGVTSLSRLEVTAVRGAVDNTLKAKRLWTRVAVLIVVVALGLAGYVVISVYGAGAVSPAATPSSSPGISAAPSSS